ncbi:superoxide dismutase family protein [Acerihabitans sp. TG2]|uniref:superoxide dismutase family protein n=1 Tax=Acerihabitans sp. TG2 TaxID=3096008 RepID=UPI002B22FDF9|nr:superoxide dismutase family protein [Acerihabitans sp. TG2]MEA9391914.1 superoxide dismutase family protein [Acerihabitans sp. TG2]
MRRTLFCVAAILSANMAWAQAQPVVRTLDLVGLNGKNVGKITLTEAAKGVILRLEANGFPQGWHGIHFHEKGVCDANNKFKDAGGHVHAMTSVVHGLLNANANDDGDLTNVYAGADGKINAEIYSTLVSVYPGRERPALLDGDGASVIIHANPDDYQSQPIGGAGDRIACAVIK